MLIRVAKVADSQYVRSTAFKTAFREQCMQSVKSWLLIGAYKETVSLFVFALYFSLNRIHIHLVSNAEIVETGLVYCILSQKGAERLNAQYFLLRMLILRLIKTFLHLPTVLCLEYSN